MKHFTLSLFVLSAFALGAQPVLTSSDFLSPTVTGATLSEVPFMDMSQDIQTNGTWDFSGATGGNQVINVSLLDLATAGGADFFEGADYALGFEDLNQFYEVNDFVSELGYYSDTGGGEGSLLIRNYDISKKYFNLPLSLGDAGSELFTGTMSVGSDFEEVISGLTTWEVVGHGTLTLAVGTFDVLMVHGTESSKGVIDVNGIEILNETTLEQYGFYTPGYPFPIVSFVTTTSTIMGQSSTTESGVVMTGETVGVTPVAEDRPTISIYPNPASTSVRLALPNSGEAVNLSLFDLSGQVQRSERVFANGQEVVMDVRDLSAGLYLMRIESGDWVETRRLVVQH